MQHLDSIIISRNVRKIKIKTQPLTDELSRNIMKNIKKFILDTKILACIFVRNSTKKQGKVSTRE